MTDDWKPVPGATVTEQGDGYAVNYPALYECPTCAAAVPRGRVEKHSKWHQTLRSSTGVMGSILAYGGEKL